MNLENVTAEMRPRSEWEAADLGARMVRRDAAAIYRVWFCITIPMLSIAMLLAFYSPYPAIAGLLYWWFEPVTDGPILRIISRRLFGEDADVRAALRATGRLAWQNKIFFLTPYRFHFARSTAIPVTQLEGLKGDERRSRAKVLNVKILNYGTGVTTAYQHLALALYIGVVLIGFTLVPLSYQDSLGQDWIGMFWDGSSSRWATALGLLAMYIAQTALHPWFVGAGFGLYINCRTQLEAWDIEVAFRRMIQRRENGLATTIALLLIVALPGYLLSNRAEAQETPVDVSLETQTADAEFTGYWSDEDIGPSLDTVAANELLKTTRDVDKWQSLTPDEPEIESDDGSPLADLLAGIGQLFAFVVEFGLWIVVALLIALVAFTAHRWLPQFNAGRSVGRGAERVMLVSGELTADMLPEDISGEVARLWQSGAKRRALSLLYRGSVFAAVTRHGVKLPPSATEGGCLSAVEQQSDAERSEYFRKIVSAWILCAYGFREPRDDIVLPLFADWRKYYGETT